LQGAIFKKCDRALHRPESRKACANDICQHTCDPDAVETCRHAWTVRYSVAGKLSEKSFRDEIDPRTKRVKTGSGKKKAEDFRLKLSHDKRAQGKSFTDPALGRQAWTGHAEEWIFTSARLKASADSRKKYAGLLRGDLAKAFREWTLEDMCTEAAADKAGELVNVTLGHRSIECRRLARMIILRSMDAAVRAGKVHRHQLQELTVDPRAGTFVSRRERIAAAASDDDADEGAGQGFVFVTDAQVAMLADGITVPAAPGRLPRRLAGMGMAAWLQRILGLRIREALGTEKADFRTRKDGSHYLRLRSQAARKGEARQALKHRREGQGRDIEIPEPLWNMVQALPDGPLCPGVHTRYMPYSTVAQRLTKLATALGIEGYTSHSLRHQFASEALEQIGVGNIAALAEVLGHRSAETTLRVYVHPSADAGERIAAMMSTRWAALPAA
jgi:hypothetical protein